MTESLFSLKVLEVEEWDYASLLFSHQLSTHSLPVGSVWTYQTFYSAFKNNFHLCVSIQEEYVGALFYSKVMDQCEIFLILVVQSWIRKGVGHFLLEALVEKEQPEEMWLEVHELNFNAQNLYHKFGFKVHSRRSNYYRKGGDCLVYHWINSCKK